MTLHPDLTNMIVRALPAPVKDLLEHVGPRLLVAGGFCRDVIRGEEPRDLDIFARNEKALWECINEFEGEEYRRKETGNSVTFFPRVAGGLKIQFIKRAFYRTFEGTIASFDFSICQVGIYFDSENGWQGISTPEFMEDITRDRMRYTAPDRDEDPGASVLRMVRFAERGFKINQEGIASCIGRFVARIDQEYVGSAIGMTDEEATKYVTTAFKKIGYAGKKATESISEDCPF